MGASPGSACTDVHAVQSGSAGHCTAGRTVAMAGGAVGGAGGSKTTLLPVDCGPRSGHGSLRIAARCEGVDGCYSQGSACTHEVSVQAPPVAIRRRTSWQVQHRWQLAPDQSCSMRIGSWCRRRATISASASCFYAHVISSYMRSAHSYVSRYRFFSL